MRSLSSLNISKIDFKEKFILNEYVWLVFTVVFLALLFANEPAHAQSGNVYRNSGAQAAQNVTRGVVVGTRMVETQARDSTRQVGSVIGAALGGGIASQMGNQNNYASRAVLGLIGAALGGFGGNMAAESIGNTRSVEILVQLRGRNGEDQILGVVQPLPGPDVVIGQQVLVLNERGMNRVIPAQNSGSQLQPYQAPVNQTREGNNSQDFGYRQVDYSGQ